MHAVPGKLVKPRFFPFHSIRSKWNLFQPMANKVRGGYGIMLETKKFPELVETSLAYALGAAAALLAFLLVWLICSVAAAYQG